MANLSDVVLFKIKFFTWTVDKRLTKGRLVRKKVEFVNLHDKQKEGATDHKTDYSHSFNVCALIKELRQEEVFVEEFVIPRKCQVVEAVEIHNQCDKCRCQKSQHREQEAHEDSVVVNAYTIIDPRTMMVESLDASVAYAAVA